MTFEFKLTKFISRLAFAFGALGVCAFLLVIIVSRFVVGTLADTRISVTTPMLRVPVEYFPGSPRLNARLATAELVETDRDLASAEGHAQRAVNLSPYDYRFRLTLASIKEAEGDRAAAEESLESARALAPHYWTVHYRLGNLLLREGKRAESIYELRTAVSANRDLLPGTLDLVWRATGGDTNAVRDVSGSDPRNKLALARFLIRMSRPLDAASIFSGVARSDRVASPSESSAFVDSLVGAGQIETAHDLWLDLVGSDRAPAVMWNGGFESDLARNFTQFEWGFARTDYARLAIDKESAHTGSRSLRIEFTGRDTTKLDNEIRQLVALRPGGRYRLECYVRTSGFESPEGPRLVVTDGSSKWIASSEPVAQGTNDWRLLSVDFIAPDNPNGGAVAVSVSIKRKPMFSYDEPTRGTLWFDDFSINERK